MTTDRAPKIAIHPAFLNAPICHRGYHDKSAGRPENSIEAFEAAINAGYGIELDVQLTADNQAVVFHDYQLYRLTGQKGVVRKLTLDEMAQIPLQGGKTAAPSLRAVLELVAGRVPVLVEIKDQDGQLGPNIGPLEAATAAAIGDYRGPLAVMSFNPESIQTFGRLRPDIARGLTTSAYAPEDWAYLTADVRDRLRDIPDYERTSASFISHEAADLAAEPVARVKASGGAILCWTIKSARAEAKARLHADNVTFEGYAAKI